MFRRVVALGAVCAALAGCTPFAATTSGDTRSGNRQAKPPVAARTNVDAGSDVAAGKRISIQVSDPWLLESIDVDDGTTPQHLDLIDETVWESAPLRPEQRLSVSAFFRNQVDGETQTITRTAQAGKANGTFEASVYPNRGTWGVGFIPSITFSRPIPKKARAAIEEQLRVTTAPIQIAGAWRWIDSTNVAFRPKNFWPGHTTVTIDAALTAIQLPGTTTGWWGNKDVHAQWKTGKSTVIRINAKTDRGTMTVDGNRVRRFPVSTGKPGYTTRSGVKTITDMFEVQRMTNIGVTDDEVYDLQVPYAMRMTSSGEFLHGAPWNGNIGYANTSHGCTNLTLSDARWIFNRVRWGDPVITTGTGRAMEDDNGPGALWNIPYAKWTGSP